MPVEFRGWRLYLREIRLTKGPPAAIYFFSRKLQPSTKPSDVPAARAVAVNAEVGYPLLTEDETDATPGAAAYSFEGWGLYRGNARDEETGQVVDVLLFCRSRPKGFLAMPAPPPGRVGRWHPVNDLPSLSPANPVFLTR